MNVTEPHIQYVKTSDGVSIAYWTMGTGTPLVYLPPTPMHVQLSWRLPPMRDFYQHLARRHQLIRFDRRGFGLSQRDGYDGTIDELLLDLRAVIDRLGIDTCVLMGHGGSATVAIAAAATMPERVEKLVIVNGAMPLPEWWAIPAMRALIATIEHDWFTFTELIAYMVWGWKGDRLTRQYAELMRASVTWEQFKGEGPQLLVPKFAAFLPRVQAPTLVVDHLDSVVTSVESARRLATDIPNAELVLLDGAVGSALLDPLMMVTVDRFLAGEDDATSGAGSFASGMSAILFTDIADSTLLTERMGDAAFRGAARTIDEGVRAAIRMAGGSPVEGKVLGDGVMGVFPTAAQAIDAALGCVTLSAKSELRLHIGLHAGDVIREDDNVYGGAVNIAARICGLCDPGEILVSATVRDLARTSAGVTFEDRGERALKGVEDLVRVFAVRAG